MSQPQASLARLALREHHAAAGAKFRVCGLWELPADYGDAQAEHAALRSSVVVFDRSHRSRILVSGTDAADLLGRVFARNVMGIEEGRAVRTFALDECGLVGDIALIVRTGAISYLVCGEPGQRQWTVARLQGAKAEDFDARVEDRTLATCTLAVTGPGAEATLREHVADALPAALEPLQSVAFEFHGFRALVTRTSDTGEDGFEFVLAPAAALHLMQILGTAGVLLAGDTAHETARIEECIPAYSPDLEIGLTPAEAGLDALLGIGGSAAERVLCAVILENEVTAGTPVMAGALAVGEVRSCVRSFSLGAIIALAVIDQRHSFPGAALVVGGRPAAVVARPFYRRRREA